MGLSTHMVPVLLFKMEERGLDHEVHPPYISHDQAKAKLSLDLNHVTYKRHGNGLTLNGGWTHPHTKGKASSPTSSINNNGLQ